MLKQKPTRPLRKNELPLLEEQFKASGTPQKYARMQMFMELAVEQHDDLSKWLELAWEASGEPVFIEALRMLQLIGYYHHRFEPSDGAEHRLLALKKRRLAGEAFEAIEEEFRKAKAAGETISWRQAIERACARGAWPLAASLSSARKQVQEQSKEDEEWGAPNATSDRMLLMVSFNRAAARKAAAQQKFVDEAIAAGDVDADNAPKVDYSGVITHLDWMHDEPLTRRTVEMADSTVLFFENIIGHMGYSDEELKGLVEHGLGADLQLDESLERRGLPMPSLSRLRQPGLDYERGRHRWSKQVGELMESDCCFASVINSCFGGQDAHALLREREDERSGNRLPMFQWDREEEHYIEWRLLKEAKREALGTRRAAEAGEHIRFVHEEPDPDDTDLRSIAAHEVADQPLRKRKP